MAAVRGTDSRDARGMPRSLQPVVNRGADLAPLHRRVAAALVARDQQDDALLRRNRPLQSCVNRAPRPVERHPVKVDDAVGPNIAGPQPPVPAGIQRAR